MLRPIPTPFPALPFLLLLTGCTDEWTDETLTDVGDACFYAEEDAVLNYSYDLSTLQFPEQTYAEGQPLVVQVGYDGVGGCKQDETSSCSITREGNTLTIQNTVNYRQMVSSTECTLEIGYTVALCQSEPLEAGTYTLIFGDSSQTLEVTSTRTAFCMPATVE